MQGQCPDSNRVKYGNNIVCFVLIGAENLPAHGRKTEKNIALAELTLISTLTIHRTIFCEYM
jgi:hypothetical protein